jgi:RNA polymerase primary sigma factor
MAVDLEKSKKTSFDEGSLDLYLKEISRYPLITREEEARLARRIR